MNSGEATGGIRTPGAVRGSNAGLSVLVVGAGCGTLALEISASRMLAPYYGSSTIVWANLIGIVLLALSLGYWFGGRVADRRPSHRMLGALVVAAGGLVALLALVANALLDLASTGFGSQIGGAILGSFLATLVLFAPPVFVLGMVSPFAVRLAVGRPESAGSDAGRVYALSTAGSLAGVYLAAFLLIPAFGTWQTMLVSGAVLALSGAAVLHLRPLTRERPR